MPLKHKDCDNPYIGKGKPCKEETCSACHWNSKLQDTDDTLDVQMERTNGVMKSGHKKSNTLSTEKITMKQKRNI